MAATVRVILRVTKVSGRRGDSWLNRIALAAHASQLDQSWFVRFPEESFAEVFGHESFIRILDSTGAAVPEDDLFVGLR